MARVELVTEQQATGRVREIYEDIKATMGWEFVPQTFQVIAHNPDHLESYWEHYRQTMAPRTAGPENQETNRLHSLGDEQLRRLSAVPSGCRKASGS